MVSGGQSVPLDELPEWTPHKVYKYPMAFVNPMTGVKSFQIMPEVAQSLYLKTSVNEVERVEEDEEVIRVWLNKIFDRIAKPEYILVPRTEEGDVVIWNNQVRCICTQWLWSSE